MIQEVYQVFKEQFLRKTSIFLKHQIQYLTLILLQIPTIRTTLLTSLNTSMQDGTHLKQQIVSGIQNQEQLDLLPQLVLSLMDLLQLLLVVVFGDKTHQELSLVD